MSLLPMADAVSDVSFEKKIRKLIAKRQLVGAANNVKWNRLISLMRQEESTPCYRTKIVSGYMSHWDNDWYYGLPFPMLSVECLDIEYEISVLSNRKFTGETINCKKSLIKSLVEIGFEFETKNKFVRMFGYFPKCYEGYFETD
ncbi:DUF6678 family protein, partial [Glaciecola sp. KUL10]|uniref:DUF6678 family protein n=1 Tax=Glaciecola sp. (strain KUL10) TaxID=2161813 RepID=UPI000D7843EC